MLYDIILADPPWQFSRSRGKGVAADQYPTMPLAELRCLPIKEQASDNCCLFLWGCWALLPEALELIKAWGFTYKCAPFVWVKTNAPGLGMAFGLGSYTRTNTEVVLLGTRGKPKRVNASVPQVLHSPLRGHSRKPGEIHERIVALMGDLPRLELFARRPYPGWDVWGNEVASTIEI